MDFEDLHGYQHTSVDHIIQNTHSGLFLDMGLGKTVSTLTAINALMYEELEVSRVLVIAPRRVAESVWDAEALKWSHLKHLRISKIIGSEKQRRKALAEKADIHLISRDNIAWLCGQYGGSNLPFDMLIIDELSSFKNSNSLRFKALKKVQPSFRRVVGLTGTPAPNGLIDLWSQIYLLDRGERLGKFIGHYRETYFRAGGRNGAVVYKYNVRKGAEDIIHSKIADICISMKAKDYLDLPGTIENIIMLDMPADVRKRYDEFEKDLVLSLFLDENGQQKEITAANAAALNTKLLQFANGAVYDADKKFHVVHDIKLEAIEELIEAANGKPFLIAWTFRHDVERLLKRLKKYKPRELKTDEDIQDWNEGKINVMLLHPASGGHGLNLQDGGNNLAWFGNHYSLELDQQLNARLNRQGQKNIVVINKLVMRGTTDEDVIASLSSKTGTQDALMDAVKARIQKHIKKL